MKIEIRPIARKKWHGKTGKEDFARPIKLGALVNPLEMTYATGLDYNNKNYTDPDTKEKVTEAEYYSKLLKQDLSNNFTATVPHPFWDSPMASVKLENNTMFLYTERPLDFIKYKICKASKYVANSLKEYEEGFYPEATHILYDEKEEVEAKATKVENKNKAIIACADLSKDRKVQLILVLAGKNLKGKADNFVTVELDKIVENQANEVLALLNEDKEYVALKAMVLEALQRSILKKVGHKINYFESTLGNDIEDVINYFRSEENQDLKLRILSALN